MKQSFLNHIKQKNLFARKDKILLAISGGLDSMVMLHLFQECGLNIGVAHVNFQLRGEESDGDENFVKTYCAQSSIPFFTKKFETESYAKQNHLSTQMAARVLRYRWFNEILEDQHFDFVATAHHLNDSIETMLLNFVRGSGLEGWDGIELKNDKVIHPLLFATREQITTYAKENEINWREDRSNASDDYQRNFIRHNVVPLLKELNPSFENSFCESMNKVSGAVELEALGIAHWQEKFQTKKGEQILLNKKGFLQFKNPESVLWNLIKGFGFNFDQCLQLIASLHGQPGKHFSSSKFKITIDREFLIISKHQEELSEVLIEKGQTRAVLGDLKLIIEKLSQKDFKGKLEEAVLNADKLIFPLRWRKWRPGDYFFPLGMNHKKKISDLLIDQKISLTDKENITVLESGNEIVWVVGLRIDDRYKVIDGSCPIAYCQLSTVD